MLALVKIKGALWTGQTEIPHMTRSQLKGSKGAASGLASPRCHQQRRGSALKWESHSSCGLAKTVGGWVQKQTQTTSAHKTGLRVAQTLEPESTLGARACPPNSHQSQINFPQLSSPDKWSHLTSIKTRKRGHVFHSGGSQRQLAPALATFA